MNRTVTGVGEIPPCRGHGEGRRGRVVCSRWRGQPEQRYRLGGCAAGREIADVQLEDGIVELETRDGRGGYVVGEVHAVLLL